MINFCICCLELLNIKKVGNKIYQDTIIVHLTSRTILFRNSFKKTIIPIIT